MVPRRRLEQILAEGSPDDVPQALVSAAFHEPDWQWVQDWCLRLSEHPDQNVRRVAVIALGHLARIHRRLDLDRVLPTLAARADEPELAGTVEDTLEDIRMFIIVS